MLKYFLTLLLVINGLSAFAQYVDPATRNDGIMDKDISLDSADMANMSERPPREKLGKEYKYRAVEGWFIPSTLRVGVDLWSLGETAFTKGNSDLRIHADTDIGRWHLSAEFGRQVYTARRDSIFAADNSWIKSSPIYNYESKGQYIKYGVDLNLSPRSWDRSMVFFGVRRADSFYSERFSYLLTNDFGDSNQSLSLSGSHTSWYELLFGYRANIGEGFGVGWTGGLQFGTSTADQGTAVAMMPSFAPGYGLLRRKSRYFFELNLYYTIRFWDKGIPKAKPK
ncbi:DUF6048 family protein [Persicobacter psychrovividus]|uniref:Uncharacterized protein n=1 Tax=Persicobacter psychrovividus TaxID=387638 RepID=A0ABM7VBF4_9BACT|nr:hypothetical protein PEPS_05340 [Persicobacter psychrovividus]